MDKDSRDLIALLKNFDKIKVALANKLRDYFNHSNYTLPNYTLQEVEHIMIAQALKQNFGNQAATARQLGISIRTVQRKIKKYKIEKVTNYA